MGLSRGQIVGLVTIALFFAFLTLIFDLIVSHNAKKIDYLSYDSSKVKAILEGNYLEYVNLGETYKEKGINTKKKVSISYFKDNRQVSGIDTSKYGTYEVRYYIGGKNYITRTVIVIDNESPVIKVPDKTIISKEEALTFDLEKGVIVTDNSNDVKLSYDNNLKAEKGDYIITYTAIDSSNNKTSKKRLIKINWRLVINNVII